jgi:hypothetical protein
MEFNPLHAPLYHSLAELEARVFNVEGLSRLNQRASKVFNKNALEPAKFTSQAFGTKIRAQRKKRVPRALAEKIVNDDGGNGPLGINATDHRDPFTVLDSMADNMIEELLRDL